MQRANTNTLEHFIFQSNLSIGSLNVFRRFLRISPSFQLLGVWYAIEKTGTASSCVVYNFTKTDEPYEYDLVQTSQHFILKYTPVKHVYKYTGRLTVPDLSTPAKMSVKFPLSE